MAVLAPAMLLVLVYFGVLDDRSATQSGWLTPILLVFSGVVTALPLLLFSAGAKRVPLTVLGVLQYIAPTIQLFLGVWLYREPFSPHRLIGFALVWAALALFVVESLAMRRRPYLSPRTTVAV
jgi:chloramphenicol-sensitive protein RarD